MSKKFKDSEINKEFAIDIWKTAQSFGNGIYVPSNSHPCGWDFINFIYTIETEDDIDTNLFCGADISNGYGNEEFSRCTLLEILKKVYGQVVFEKSQIDW